MLKDGFFSDLMARDGILRTISFFPVPSEDSSAIITPMDRLSECKVESTDLTPLVHKAWMTTDLYRLRMKKMRLGGLDLRYVAIAFGILGLVLAIMYFGGYFG